MSQRLQQIQQGSSALKPPPGYSQQDDKKKSEGAGEWWKELNDDQECPITLEPLNSLPYPPFRLGSSLFDGLALASYVVSRGIFQNPLNRQDLTRNDCVRLDDYLQAHCFAEQSLLTVKTHPSRRLSVTEAFVLHQRVRVEDNQSDSSSSRAQVLRHTATAALAGLFVYGNDQRNSQTNDSNSQEQNTGASIWSPQPQELLPSSLLQDWGLDLNRNVEDTALQQEENYRVIDDDEAMNVATQRHQYQQVQEAFPRLSTSADDDENTGSESVPSVQPDTEFVAKVHRQAVVDARVEQERQLRLEVARQKLLQEALQRREERRQKRLQQLREGKKQQQVKEQEQEELNRVRQEIEAWREEQWEKLRLVSEKHQKTEQAEQRAREEEKMKLKQVEEEAEFEKRDHLLKEDQMPTEEELVERKRQKAAEKKRRARERQKAKKAQQRAVQEEQRKQEELEAKKAAASKQCDACGQGILGHGFEKFDQHFCSPACARTAKPKR